MTSRLVLVGYRASGKSTVGRAAARRLGWRFVDSDQRLESELGPIAAFFAAHGEAEFRRRESACLAALLAETGPQVLATGGGIVLVESNRTALRTLSASGALIVYLHADADCLAARLRQDAGGRPSLTGGSVADEVPRILGVREPLYRQVADAVIDASLPRADVVAAVVELARPATDGAAVEN